MSIIICVFMRCSLNIINTSVCILFMNVSNMLYAHLFVMAYTLLS